MEDYIEEELAISEEQAREDRVLTAEIFQRPISDIYRRPRVDTVPESAPIYEVVALMELQGVGAVAVVHDEALVGIVSTHDLVTRVMARGLPMDSPVAKVMTRRPESFMPDDALAYLFNAIQCGSGGHFPIVDANNRPLSIVSTCEALAYILDECPEQVTNIPSIPFRGKPERYGA